MHPHAPLPAITDVPDLPQDPAFPVGFDSAPFGPAAQVESLGFNSVIAFAISYQWATSDYRKSARGWAKNITNACAWAATMREYADTLTTDEKTSLNLSCNLANVIGGGSYENVVYAIVSGKTSNVAGAAFPAQFTPGSGLSGETTSEKGPADAKLLAFNDLISAVREGAYLLGSAVA